MYPTCILYHAYGWPARRHVHTCVYVLCVWWSYFSEASFRANFLRTIYGRLALAKLFKSLFSRQLGYMDKHTLPLGECVRVCVCASACVFVTNEIWNTRDAKLEMHDGTTSYASNKHTKRGTLFTKNSAIYIGVYEKRCAFLARVHELRKLFYQRSVLK